MALDREAVVRAGLELLDTEGLEGLTLRKIAAALDVKAPALYWHFQNKQQLLDEMATTMARDAYAGHDLAALAAERPWQDLLRVQADGLRRMLLGHRDGARLFGGTAMTDSGPVVAGEPLLRALTDAGADLRTATAVLRTLNCFVLGFVLEEQGIVAPDGQRDPRFDPMARSERVDRDRYPLTSASSEHLFGDLDRSFRDGVDMIIGGVRLGERG
ncbi:TetR/AcrR family transcriptional regulator C-terminal domain-containing protein [Microlunatus soli]|nr:TetR/AcrR family transcriptional regulator C-terminal domain-containing protein [Microlunatus soli]